MLWYIGLSGNLIRWMETPAIGIYIYQITGSVMQVAVVGFLRMIPLLIFGPLIGQISDNINRKFILLFGFISLTIVYVLLSYLSLVNKLDTWHIYFGSFFAGLIWAMDFPVRRALISEVVGRLYITQAFAFDLATTSFGRILGPLSAGIIISYIGISGSYIFSFILFVSASISIYLFRYKYFSKKSKENNSFIKGLFSGIKFISKSELLFGTILITIIMNMFAFPYAQMVPVIGKDVLFIGPIFIGLLLSLEGFGATLGSIFIAFTASKKYYTKIYFFGSLLFLSSILLFGIVEKYWLALPIIFIGSIGLAGFATMQSIIIVNSTPKDKRGVVLGVLSAAIGTGPIGVINIGLLASFYGAHLSVFIFALIGIILVLFTGFYFAKVSSVKKY